MWKKCRRSVTVLFWVYQAAMLLILLYNYEMMVDVYSATLAEIQAQVKP